MVPATRSGIASDSKRILDGTFGKAILGIGVLALAALVLRYTALRLKNPSTAVAPVTDPGASPWDKNLRLSGTTQAAQSFMVLAPQLEAAQLTNMVITFLIPAGAHVQPGDVLVRFDPQAQVKDYLEKQNKYTELAGQAAQKRGEEELARAKDETGVHQAESDYKKAQLELQKNEVLSRIDAEKNQETLEETQATFQQLQQTFQLKRKAAAAAIHILELQRDRAEEAMQYAQSNANKMTIRSPMHGIAVLNAIFIEDRVRTVQAGDAVMAGTSFMQVVDPSKMEVRVGVVQSDVEEIHVGDHAQICPDAYPGMSLPAVLDEISPLGQEGNFSDKIRIFSARFSVQGNDPRLLPDLSVAVDLELPSNRNANEKGSATRH